MDRETEVINHLSEALVMFRMAESVPQRDILILVKY